MTAHAPLSSPGLTGRPSRPRRSKFNHSRAWNTGCSACAEHDAPSLLRAERSNPRLPLVIDGLLRSARNDIGFAGVRDCRLSRQEVVCDRQGAEFVGFQRDLLGQHDIAGHEIIFRNEAPAGSRPTCPIELIDVGSGAVAYPVALSAMAASHVEILVLLVLRKLLLG